MICMNKKGFTLVELLAVILLLLVIISITVPVVTKIIENSKNSVYKTQVNKILSATYDYSLKNSKLLPDNNNEKRYITLGDLQNKGYINTNVVDPKVNDFFSSDLVISIKKVDSNYKYDDKNSILKGYYLYTVEFNFMKTSEFTKNKPNISLDGYGTTSFTSNIELSSLLDEPMYTAYSYNGEDITNKVTKTILYNSNVVEKVDTSAAGIYYINYTVVDNEGYSNNLVRSIIIVDTVAPSLEIPENVTISTNITKFDLFEGVNCTDNSGKCDIKIEGKIKFGEKGKYIIKYISSDPTGNTSTLKRVITVD